MLLAFLSSLFSAASGPLPAVSSSFPSASLSLSSFSLSLSLWKDAERKKRREREKRLLLLLLSSVSSRRVSGRGGLGSLAAIVKALPIKKGFYPRQKLYTFSLRIR
jgi:hypothetical protein